MLFFAIRGVREVHTSLRVRGAMVRGDRTGRAERRVQIGSREDELSRFRVVEDDVRKFKLALQASSQGEVPPRPGAKD